MSFIVELQSTITADEKMEMFRNYEITTKVFKAFLAFLPTSLIYKMPNSKTKESSLNFKLSKHFLKATT